MFFDGNHYHFFKPLYGKYREGTAMCLTRLYQKIYSHDADFGYHLTKDGLLDVFSTTLSEFPILEGEDGPQDGLELKSIKDLSSMIFRNLLNDGWLEGYKDQVSLQTVYRFSTLGRKFTYPMVERNNQALRTTQRHTRNTSNALRIYLLQQESHDLIDAFDFSEKIVSDFTDVVAEIEEKKRFLVQSAKQGDDITAASKAFFSFMQNKFLPDIAVRLSADSVERHRETIMQLIESIRHFDKEKLVMCEKKLRADFPILVEYYPNQSVLYKILDIIEKRVNAAIELKLPEIRESISSFSRRANIVIRQLSYFSNRKDESLERLCEKMRRASPSEQNLILDNISLQNPYLNIGFICPSQIKLREAIKKPTLQNYLEKGQSLPFEEQKNQYIRARLNSAFIVSDEMSISYLRRYVKQKGDKVKFSELPIDNAADFLAVTHLLSAITALKHQSKVNEKYELIPLHNTYKNDYLSGEDYEIIRQ